MEISSDLKRTYVAFDGGTRVASGSLIEVAVALRKRLDSGNPSLVLIFDQADGKQIDVDLAGAPEDIERRLSPAPPAARRGRGRPKLGVVGREVTLLPRHWEWLQKQRGGPSATLRRLVDEARAAHRDLDRVRQAQDAIHRFVSATAGDLPGYEEATRALYRQDRDRFASETARWPSDIRDQVELWQDTAFAAVED